MFGNKRGVEMTQSTLGGGAAAMGGSGAQQPQQQSSTPLRRMHPIRPLTIKQLLQAQSVADGVMVVDGREVTQATVIGCIMEYETAPPTASGALTAKHYGYRITDHTGFIVVRQWIDAESTQQPLPRFTHVRASGTVKVWKDTPIITGTVVAVADSNEMNYHLLDTILTHLRLTQGDKSATMDATKDGRGVPTMTNTPAAIGVQNVLPGGDSTVRLTDLLVNIIKQTSHGDMGMSMDELVTAAQRYNFGANDVRVAMRTLAAEGKVYQTHDNRFNI